MSKRLSNNKHAEHLWQKMPFDWSTPPARAAMLQHELASQVVLCPMPEPSLVAGVDIAYSVGGATGYAVAVVLALPKLKIVDTQTEIFEIRYPYRAGLLSMREGPLTAAVLKKLTRQPDIIIFDGAGVAHPRRLGISVWLALRMLHCRT